MKRETPIPKWLLAGATTPAWLVVLSLFPSLMGWVLFLVPGMLAQFVNPSWNLDIFPWMTAPPEPKILLIGTYVAGIGLTIVVAAVLVYSLGQGANAFTIPQPGAAALILSTTLAICGVLGVVLVFTLGRTIATALVLALPLVGMLGIRWGATIHPQLG